MVLFCVILIVGVFVSTVYQFLTEDHLLALPIKANYTDAIGLCKIQEMDLVKVRSDISNMVVYNFAYQRRLGRYWMDGNDIENEGNWVYNDKNEITYQMWQKGEPNNYGDEDCLEGLFYINWAWNDIACDRQNAVICYRQNLLTNTIVFEEHNLVDLPNPMNFSSALKSCKAEGMNLVRIQSERMNKIVYNFAVNKKLGPYWIDANDIQTEGKWVYSNGNRVVYSKWFRNEPNNLGNEDCVHGNFFKNTFWNDISCNGYYSVICYKSSPVISTVTPPVTKSKADCSKEENPKLVITNEILTYDEAVEFCNSQDMNLIRIDSVEMNKLVYDSAKARNLDSYWIDGNDRKANGLYEDSREIPLEFINLKNKNTLPIQNRNCIVGGKTDLNMQWIEADCDLRNSVICIE